MDKLGAFMQNTDDIVGSPNTTPLEESLAALQVHLLVSRREAINPLWSRQSYCSPFWRLYVNNRCGAGIWSSAGYLPLPPGRPILVPAWLNFRTHIDPVPHAIYQDYLHFECLGLPGSLQRELFTRPVVLAEGGAVELLSSDWRKGLDGGAPSPEGWLTAQSLASAAAAVALGMLEPAARASCVQWLGFSGFLEPILNHIERHLGQPLSNRELAALCHLSPDHFIRTFRRLMGITPAQYVLERRITAAATYLAQSTRTIDDIAEAVGFTDRFHFSRSFKTRIGIPPATYRQLHRAS